MVLGERVGLREKFKIALSSQCIRWPFLAYLHDEILQRYFPEDKKEWKTANIFVSLKRK